MKITYISSDIDDDTGRTRVSLNIQSDLSPAEAISSVLALFAGTKPLGDLAAAEARGEIRVVVMKNVIDELPSNDRPRDAQVDEAVAVAAAAAPKADEPATAKVTRTRRPRTNPDAAPATETPVVDQSVQEATPVEGRRRTRVTQEPAAETVKVITDADLAKAASNGAAQVGKEIIEIIMEELSVAIEWPVKSVSDIPTDKREWFLTQIANEIQAAKDELAGVGK